MYEYLDTFVRELNDTPSPENMHLLFMLRLAELLGIGAPETMTAETISASLNRTTRQQLLRQLCDYYLNHLETFRLPKSLDILIEVFD